MIESYKEYLSLPKSLTIEQMQELHGEIISEIGSDTDAVELYNELLQKAGKYSAIRSGWMHLSPQEKMDQDSRRTSCHNSVITHFNMLARYLKQQNKPALWRDKLGYEEDDPYNRKAIGDFACYLTFVAGINAR